MQPIPLISAEYVARVASDLEAAGVPVDRYLGRAHIQPPIREDPHGLLPARSLWILAGEVERSEGLGGFWLECARPRPRSEPPCSSAPHSSA
jgi:hypothetical protein